MKKFRVTCYPNRDSYTIEVEANSVEEAIDEAEFIVNNDTGFTALPEDVEEIKE